MLSKVDVVETHSGTSALMMKRSKENRQAHNIRQLKNLCRVMEAIGVQGDVKDANFLDMFHIPSLVCFLIYGVKSRSGHDRSKIVPLSA